MAKRVFIIVLDSFGIGAQPDAERFGDGGANTLVSVSKSEKLNIPTLISLGLSEIEGVGCLPKSSETIGAFGRMTELSLGKDTTIGHWELMGIYSDSPFPTYPNGFPEKVLSALSKECGRGIICNRPYSGTDVIRDYGEEHIKTGSLIVYTSADSVFQIAAHEDIVPLAELYEICGTARKILTGKNSVGRVIARPFVGEAGSYKRTANRRDFSLPPPKKTALDAIKCAGLSVIGVGKISDIFAGAGLTESIPTHSNSEGMEVLSSLIRRDFSGLCFVNLVEFDSHYGHRQDRDGYALALSEFDRALSALLPTLSDEDVLMISADHGCDPSDDSTDHTREYVPLLIYGKGVRPINLGTLSGFFSVGKTAAGLLGIDFEGDGGIDFSARLF